MSTTVKPIPDGYHTVTPYMIVDGAARALDFYKRAFNAAEVFRMESGGRVHHAEIQIGNSRLMLADEVPAMGARGPASIGGSPIALMLYVENCDESFAQAVAAGAEVVRPPANQFYGDRSGAVKDPFGYQWHLATHIEDVAPEELKARAAKLEKC